MKEEREMPYLGDKDNVEEFLDTMDALREQFKDTNIVPIMKFKGLLYSISETRDAIANDIKMRDEKAQEDELKREKEQEEMDRKHDEEMEKKAKEKLAEAEAKMPAWKEKAEKYIMPEKMEEWEKYMEQSSKDPFYYGADIDAALDVMEKLENGASIEEIAEGFSEQGYSHALNNARLLVLNFSEKGPNFYEGTPWKDNNGEKFWKEEDQKLVEDKRREIREIRSERRIKAKEQGIDMPYTEADAIEAYPDWSVVKDIDDVIKFVQDMQSHGIPCYVTMHGDKRVYSFKSAEENYLAVTGVKSKEEDYKRQEEMGKKIEEMKNSAKRGELEDKVNNAKDEKTKLEEDIELTEAEITMAREVEEEQKSKELLRDDQVKQ